MARSQAHVAVVFTYLQPPISQSLVSMFGVARLREGRLKWPTLQCAQVQSGFLAELVVIAGSRPSANYIITSTPFKSLALSIFVGVLGSNLVL